MTAAVANWVGARVDAGEPLFTVRAESLGELEYALAYAHQPGEILAIEERP